MEEPLRNSLFANVPPFLNYLPNGLHGSLAGPSQQHTDTMVELRESLWRIPMAFHNMVSQVEEENINKEKNCKLFDSKVSLPMAFMRENKKCPGGAKRNSFFINSQILAEEAVPLITESLGSLSATKVARKNKTGLVGVFSQHHNDPKTFLSEHCLVALAPLPGFTQITRKDRLWRSYHAMQLRFGRSHFDFLAECFVLPGERGLLEERMEEEPGSWWIVKPPGKNNGAGIYLISSPSEAPRSEEEVLVQRYIPRPALIHGCKFDLRIYVLLTSVEPLRIYIYDEGLVRFCVNEYSTDTRTMKDTQSHICNYDVNKNSAKFTTNDDPLEPRGHKWTLTGLRTYFSQEAARPDSLTTGQMWSQVEELVVKSILCGLTSFKKELSRGQKREVKSAYNMYKLLGYDILLDSQRRPHLIEVNSRPNCHSDTLDAFVNRPMVSEIFKIVGYHIPLGAIATAEKRMTTSKKLNIRSDFSQFKFGFNPAIYSVAVDGQGMKKQTKFSKEAFDRDLSKYDILEDLTANDVRVLVKTAEEFSQARKFSRVFPSPTSHQYLQFFDSLSYYDKLLDAFEAKYCDLYEEGLKFIDKYCQRNLHQ